MNRLRLTIVCLLLSFLALGQSAPAPGTPPANQTEPGTPDTSKIPSDAPVITLAGLCESADKSAADCKTVITRDQFEKLVDAIQPMMPPRARRQFATRYANMLIMSTKAEEMGLATGPQYEQRMKLARMQILSQGLTQTLQKKASDISDKDIEDYYNQNKSEFDEAELHRIYIPRVQQQAPSKPKLSPAEESARTKAGEATMKAEADKLHARAVAGANLNTLQKEAFQIAGIKSSSPTTDMGESRRNNLPPSQASVMDLKPGSVSAVISDQSGYYIYKVGKKDTQPLDKLKDEIRGTLQQQRMQQAMEGVQKSATATLDESYFGPVAPPMGRPPFMRPGAPTPGQAPAPAPPAKPKSDEPK